jgi:Fic family protein
MTKEHTSLPLPFGSSELYVVRDDLEKYREELEEFISGMYYMNSRKFSRDVLFTHEVQANNVIEGYKDDVELIYNAVHHNLSIKDEERKQRILNLYKGYRYILQGKPITEDNLRELYTILSDNLLDSYQRTHMGKYYRNGEVIIDLKGDICLTDYELSNIIDTLRYHKYNDDPFYRERYKNVFLGLEPSQVTEHMHCLFDYMNHDDMFNTGAKTDIFIKSQIMHFYFVYIHPYFDINGRTARTTSMWYLMNNDVYPFIIFNRAINLAKGEYYRVIKDVRTFHNVTFFINYMMKHTLIELEKEHLMELINLHSDEDLTSLDFQSLHYILSMKGNMTYADFSTFYNNQNERKNIKQIYETMLVPLLDKKVIVQGDKTKSGFGPTESNHFFSLNESLFDKDDPKIKHLKI